jgi:hypothetical protein
LGGVGVGVVVVVVVKFGWLQGLGKGLGLGEQWGGSGRASVGRGTVRYFVQQAVLELA